MREDLTEKDVYTRQLLEKYCQWISRIEQVDQIEVELTVNEMKTKLPEADSVLHGRVLQEIGNLHEKVTEMQRMSEHMKILHDLSHTFAMTFDVNQILWKAFELVSRVMRADAFFIAFLNEGDSEFQIPISVESGVNYGPYTIPYGQGLVTKVIESGETIHLRTMSDEPSEIEIIRWGREEVDTNTCLFVPLMLGKQVIGVISVQSYKEFAYKQDDEELLKIIGFQVASAVENARLYERLYQMSFQDELTGLSNYRAFHRDLEQLMTEGRPIALIMLDSDSLKTVNDRYGHHLGDELIRRVADAMRAVAEDGDTTYRYAGDEFMLLSPNATLEEAKKKACAIRDYLEEFPLIQEDACIPITVSVGIACYPSDANTGDGLKRAADEALYRSKRNGKNCTTVYAVG
ncbi:sensor domain-containing diguanylate cyclase [Brevibacillus panacihumi]|uniref:GGDEF domain-containing protein n=1 Tax=Brevibacillus panacihumi TaxID=497735 RepID=A0A3M8DCG3_9BACL|nr:GGDEF domain-containing protein [Brevibacillus panacihumi]RNB85678.1 GGDEF domain-containing protein [Brevibacillus panacihumi]